MSLRYKGGVISATPPTPSASAATGVWTLEQQLQAEAAGNWPSQIYFGEAMRSLRFNSADSASLTRTFPSAGNRKTWTWSAWVKLSSNKNQTLFSCIAAQNDTQAFFIDMLSGGTLRVLGWSTVFRSTTALYRDFSAWYHIVVAFDTTQATASNRIKIYVNGSEVTAFDTTNNPTQNTDYGINQAALHEIGRYTVSSTGYDYLNGYMTEVVFIDGQALTPSSFGQTNSTTGVWEPKAITGLTYGTNGFYLNFQDNSGTTATTLGKDSSGNGNNWTPNNFSITAGVGNDSLVDTPYSSGTDTGAGGTVRGNYPTLNPLAQSSGTFSNGNLEYSGPNNWKMAPATILLPSTGKWYAEVNITNAPYGSSFGNVYNLLGLVAPSAISTWNYDTGTSFYISDSGHYSNYNTGSSGSFTTPVSGTVLGLAVDRDTNQVTIYRDGSAVVSNITLGITSGADLFFFRGSYGPDYGMMACNFGQRPFAYTAPSGFKALCTQNLPAPTVVQGDDYFNAVLYTGNGTSQSITGLDFSPDLVWVKSRSNAYNNTLVDSVRGVSKALVSDLTAAEDDSPGSYVTAFNSNGFSVGTGTGANGNGATYVGWTWRASDSSAVSNTQGTITSTVSANTTSGFSVVTFTAPSSGTYTFGHGLGAAPSFVIVKERTSGSTNWLVYHSSAITNVNQYLLLNGTGAVGSLSGSLGSALPNSTVVSLTSGTFVNASANAVAYCFAPVAGFSAFGKYTGTSNANGPFIYTGFRPRYVLVKISSGGSENWYLQDTARSPYNVSTAVLAPDISGAESYFGSVPIDILSNGFKIRTATAGYNTSGNTYIYAAFAENPFKYALAR